MGVRFGHVDVPLLVFDGNCGFCRRSVRVMTERIRRHPVAVPWQSLDLHAHGLTEEQCSTAVQYVDKKSRTHSGADAVAHLMIDAGLPWSVPGNLMRIPGIIHLFRAAYMWVANNRSRFRGDPA